MAQALAATCTDEEQEILRRALGPLARIIDYE
jgi:hypothetical protein